MINKEGNIMPFIKADKIQEQKDFEKLLDNPAAKTAYDEFEREYNHNRKLVAARKDVNITRQEVHIKMGFPQK
jgi:hypothetical protein